MKPAPFAYAAPATLDEALMLLSEHGDEAKVLAGGQSLMPVLNFRLARPSMLVDINRLEGLGTFRIEDGLLQVGATTRQRTLERWAAGQPSWALLRDTLALVGHTAIRSRGTVGGSLAHADPASELPALLLCLDGSVVARRRDGGAREIAAADFLLGPLTTALDPTELLTEVCIPLPPPGAGTSVQEVSRRHGDFALVGVAALGVVGADGRVIDARLALFGAGPTAMRAHAAERALRGQPPTPDALRAAAALVEQDISPESDLHATAAYRRQVAGVLAERALTQALARGSAYPSAVPETTS